MSKSMNALKSMKQTLMNLPTPINISYWWNFGSLLGIFLMIQIMSGLFMSIHYCPNISQAFNSIIFMSQNIQHGWLAHLIHMNGASMFFICMYIHIGRGLYYNSYKLYYTWMMGISMYILSMATAFLGYVLPWGQMSFWGATVITNLISIIPYVGTNIMEWIWGGFSINNATLNRFYTFHFIIPFIILFMVIMHLYFLHLTGSSNPLGLNSNLYKIPFHIYFTLKDTYGLVIFMLFFLMMIMQFPFILSDPDNFLPANPMLTPIHIQPEWYFLFAYAILRSIPNKMGGVMALISSLIILYIIPHINQLKKFNSSNFYPINQIIFWLFINLFILLTWLGSEPIEPPFMMLSQLISTMYFFYFITSNFITNIWNKLIF